MKTKLPLLSVPITLAFLLACQSLNQPPINDNNDPAQTQEMAISQQTITPTEAQVEPTPFSTTEINDVFGVPMMFVPDGEFTMGTDNPSYENPVHKVYLDSYYIDKYEVTNAYYIKCVNSGICDIPRQAKSKTRESYYGNPEFDNYPVLAVDYEQAKIYCSWRSAQLPTEAQWEKAARGTDQRRFPWGNQSTDNSLANYDSQQGDTMPVGSYADGISPYGVHDMAGNVWEWIADWYSIDYLPNSPYYNPTGPADGVNPVVRGGAWDTNWSQLEVFHRFLNVANRYTNVGFRCVKNTNQ